MNIEITNHELPRNLRHEIGDLLKDSLIGIENIQKGKNFAIWSKTVSRSIHTLVGLASFNKLDDLSEHLQHFMEIFDSFKSFEPNDEQINYLFEVIEEIQHITNDESVDFTEIEFEEFIALNPDMVGEVEIPKKKRPPKKEKNENQPTQKEEEIEITGNILFYFINSEIKEKVLAPLGDNYKIESLTKAANWSKDALDKEIDLVLVEIADDLNEEMKILKEFQSQVKNLPVIFVKKDFSKLEILELINIGGANFIQKPFSSPVISSVIDETYIQSKASQLLEKKLDFFLYQFKEIEEILEDQGMAEQLKDLKFYLNSYRKEREKFENRKSLVKEFTKI